MTALFDRRLATLQFSCKVKTYRLRRTSWFGAFRGVYWTSPDVGVGRYACGWYGSDLVCAALVLRRGLCCVDNEWNVCGGEESAMKKNEIVRGCILLELLKNADPSSDV